MQLNIGGGSEDKGTYVSKAHNILGHGPSRQAIKPPNDGVLIAVLGECIYVSSYNTGDCIHRCPRRDTRRL